MLKKLFLSTTMLMGYVLTFAQTDTTKTAAAAAPAPTPAPVTITGSVDVYYRGNFNAPVGQTNNYTSFTNSNNGFQLGMASLRADHSFGKVSATVDVGFGRRAEEFDFADGNTLFAVKQAFLSYAPDSTFKFTFGKWATHIGYELVDAYANANYSMDYMFSEGPFSHTGLRVDIALGGKTAAMVGIANPTNVTLPNASQSIYHTALAQLSTANSSGSWKFFLNYQGGRQTEAQSIQQVDLVINGTLSSTFTIGYNGTVQTQKNGIGTTTNASWWGSALYLDYSPKPWVTLAFRGEYIDDKDAVLLPTAFGSSGTIFGMPGTNNITDLTLSADFKVGNLTIIPEFRVDNASQEIFSKGDGSGGITGTKSTGGFLLAAVYHF